MARIKFDPNDCERTLLLLAFCVFSQSCLSPTLNNPDKARSSIQASALLTTTGGGELNHDFGTRAIGSETEAIITITNTGPTSARAIRASSPTPPFAFKGGSFPGMGGTCRSVLEPEMNCTLVISFSPERDQLETQSFPLHYDNGSTQSSADIVLRGRGASPAILQISDGPYYDFGRKKVGTVSEKVLTITHSGGVPATSAAVSGLISQFRLKGGIFPGTGGTCGSTISETCTIVLEFVPSETGAASSTLSITYHSGAAVITVQRELKGFVQNPRLVILGQPDPYTSNNTAYGQYGPSGVFSDGTRLLVSDWYNNRVSIWKSIPTASGTPPNLTLGQANPSSIAVGLSATASKMANPFNSFFDGTRLFVADGYYHRIQVWNSLPAANNAPADFVLGQATMTASAAGTAANRLSWPSGIWSNGNRLFVAERNNNRVLIWNTIPTSIGQPADLVLGQPNFTSNTANNGGISATTLNAPSAIMSDGTRLFVTECNNNRVLIWNSLPTSNQAPADLVLGQPNFASNTANNGGRSAISFDCPEGITTDGTKLFVSDYRNNRVLIWNSLPTENRAAAALVLGQVNMTTNTAGVSDRALNRPTGISTANGKLFVADFTNNRTLIWNSIPTSDNAPAQIVLGQGPMDSNRVNAVPAVSSTSVHDIRGLRRFGEKLLLADMGNNRVLIWNSLPVLDGAPADLVLGQPDMNSNAINNGGLSARSLNAPRDVYLDGNRLIVVDTGNNRVLIWNALPTSNFAPADAVLGQPNMTSNTANNGGISALRVNAPRSVASEGNLLYVADSGNHRVLIWNGIPSTSNVAANWVLGQPDMATGTANTGGVSAQSFNVPQTVHTDGQKFYVADFSNHRVLIWNTLPSANRVAASVVIGQPNMTSATANNGGTSAKSLLNVSGLFSNGTKLFVGDYNNARVLVWNAIPTANFTAADAVIGQSSFTSVVLNANGVTGEEVGVPASLDYDGTWLSISDLFNHRVMRIAYP